jgi:hypothetical protein
MDSHEFDEVVRHARNLERSSIREWLRSIPVRTIENWGLNAVEQILDWLEGEEPLLPFSQEEDPGSS